MKYTIALLFFWWLHLPVMNAQDAIKGGQVYSSDFVIDEIPRNISFYIPANYGSSEFYPLVVMLHPQGQQSVKFIKDYEAVIRPLADSLNAIVLFPDALKSNWHYKVDGVADSVNDVGFMSIMITYFVQQYSCNPNNIFITGFDEGALMTQKLACKLNISINAIAAFNTKTDTAQLCTPPSEIAVMNSGEFSVSSGKQPYRQAVKDAFQFFTGKLKK